MRLWLSYHLIRVSFSEINQGRITLPHTARGRSGCPQAQHQDDIVVSFLFAFESHSNSTFEAQYSHSTMSGDILRSNLSLLRTYPLACRPRNGCANFSNKQTQLRRRDKSLRRNFQQIGLTRRRRQMSLSTSLTDRHSSTKRYAIPPTSLTDKRSSTKTDI